MNKLFLVLTAAAVFSFHAAYTQGCLTLGITFTTQAQIDNFQVNYPGCSSILGNVKIQGDDIHNLNGLLCLTSIGGKYFVKVSDGKGIRVEKLLKL